MKRIILAVTLLLSIACNIEAQEKKEMRIYKNGDILYNSILSTTDSIKFSKLGSSRFLHYLQNGNEVKVVDVAGIDSIVFKQETIDEDCDWVLINGVKWATCNVGASKPEDYGNYYQWNKGTTDFLLFHDYFNSGYANATSWLPGNDPSPAGYRVPTLEEIQSLTNTTFVKYEWTTRNGVYGGRFTDRASGKCVFLPAAGCRYDLDGSLLVVGSGADYWSSTPYEGLSHNYNACYLYFLNGVADWYYWSPKSNGFPIRPVAD